MVLQEPRATVPSKNSVVVACGPNHFRFGKAAHRLPEKRGKSVRSAAHAHLCFRPPFMQQSRVVEPFVALDESLEKSFRFSSTIRGVSTELVSNGQPEQAQRQLMFRLDCQNVAADRFRLFRFVE